MWLLTVLVSIAIAKQTPAPYLQNLKRPLNIAHRGASGYIPEHTLQAYDVAAYMSADYIEPDLNPTKDFHLVINHDNLLNETSNVELLPQFAYLRTTKTIQTYEGNITETGWFIEDFTLEQIKQLRAKQRLSFRPKTFNYLLEKITIDEALEWAIKENENRKRNKKNLVGAYIELKNPTYYNSKGFPVQQMLLNTLKKFGIDDIKGANEKCPIILQCFELETLEFFSKETDLPLVYLIDSGSGLPYNMTEYASIVHGVGPDIGFIFNTKYDSTGFVALAHQNNLFVHPWTIRDDTLPAGFTAKQVYLKLLYENIDGIFTEFPDSANTYFNL
ncbi:unnamed protein product [Blepharisma stoltei]|uniref:glycerophosphodiester phosphodiesterase n=1 Tax=Blepharisma stoltei TaxID=1481888 RepID=A0AAU9IUU5_9CILI|nr:unnamed protein product [Blepharisma stoltei]